MLDWIGDDELQCAVTPDGDSYAIFVAAQGGSLTILGDKWKECPGMDVCHRRGKAQLIELCQCSRKPHRCVDQAQAMRIAELIARDYCEPRMGGGEVQVPLPEVLTEGLEQLKEDAQRLQEEAEERLAELIKKAQAGQGVEDASG